MSNHLAGITHYLWRQSWQLAVLIVAVAALSWILRNRSAHVRYLLWLIVLAKCLVPPFLTVPVAILPPAQRIEPLAPLPVVQALAVEVPDAVGDRSIAMPAVATQKHTVPPKRTSGFSIPSGREVLGAVWIIGVAVYGGVAVAKVVRSSLRLRRQRKPPPDDLRTRVGQLLSDFKMKAPPKVWLLDGIGQPFVWGLVRGDIYLPADYLKIDNTAHRRNILGHEVCHILRLDAAVNSLQVLAQVIFWFHPFVWWANQKIRMEREKCCDEMAIAHLGTKAKEYSAAIVKAIICEHESLRPVPSLAVAGPIKDIEERIRAMSRPGKKFYRRANLLGAVAILFVGLLTVPTALVLTTQAATVPAAGAESKTPSETDRMITGAEGTVVAFDDFDGGLKLNWSILHVDPTHWSLSKKPGTLTITTQDGTFHRSRSDYKNLFLIDCPTAWGQDFQVTTCILSFNPAAEWNEAGLICWNDEDNNLKLDYEWHTLGGNPETPPQRIFTVGAETQDSGGVLFRTTSFRADQQLEKVWLRVTKRGNKYTFQTSTDGKSFVPLETIVLRYGTPLLFPEGEPHLVWGDGTVKHIGLFANNGSRDGAPQIDASFDFFEVKAVSPAEPEPVRPTMTLAQAAARGDLTQVRLHIDRGADLNERSSAGDTALHYAARYGHKEVAELLIAKGADVNARNKNNDTPAHIALWEDNKETLDLLIAKGAKLSCIQFAAHQGHLPEVRSFVERGISVNARDTKEFVPLHYAAAGGYRDVVEFLIAQGADVNAKDKYGWTPLDSAAWHGHRDLVEILSKAGANVNSRYAWGETPLMWAAQKGHAHVIEMLLARGADLSAQDDGGRTGLHYAARAGHANVVELLIARSADVNAKDDSGESPLALAKQWGQKEMVELLLKHGAKE